MADVCLVGCGRLVVSLNGVRVIGEKGRYQTSNRVDFGPHKRSSWPVLWPRCEIRP